MKRAALLRGGSSSPCDLGPNQSVDERRLYLGLHLLVVHHLAGLVFHIAFCLFSPSLYVFAIHSAAAMHLTDADVIGRNSLVELC